MGVGGGRGRAGGAGCGEKPGVGSGGFAEGGAFSRAHAGAGAGGRWQGKEEIPEGDAERGGKCLRQVEIITGDEGEKDVMVRNVGGGTEGKGEQGEHLEKDYRQQVLRPRLAGALGGETRGRSVETVRREGDAGWHDGCYRTLKAIRQ